MNKQEEINEFQRKINQLKSEMSNCRHDWKGATYDPETVKEPYGYRMEKQGSDIWAAPEGFRDVDKPRWSRECKTCGFKEYTYKEEVVSVKKEPKF